MKDLTKVIDTLDSIQKVMSCMKEHLHDGIMVRTIDVDYTMGQYGVTVYCEVENKTKPLYESSATIHFSYGEDYINVKDGIIDVYNIMCDNIRVNMELDDE